MDGKTLLYKIQELLNEDSSSAFLDRRSSFQFLWEAATKFSQRTNALTNTQSITTVADQTDYTLNANFLKLRLKDDRNRYYVKYNDGSNKSFIYEKSFSDIVLANNTTSVTHPGEFAIEPDSTLDSQISSTTTSVGAASLGLVILTDTTADFSDVSAGDNVHNTTDGSDGTVISKTSSTVLVTVLFGGTDNDYTSGDSYVIQPQGRMKIVLDPPPDTAGHTMTVYYNERPDPVFHDYGVYRFPDQYVEGIVFYALWKYKYRDSEPNFGDAYFQFFETAVKEANAQMGDAMRRRKIPVNFKARGR